MRCASCPVALAVVYSNGAHAQSFPQKSIRIVVPFSAGGASDIIARIIAADLTETFGHNVVVDNRGGAGTVLGVDGAGKNTCAGSRAAEC